MTRLVACAFIFGLTCCATVPGPPGAISAGGLDRFYHVAGNLYRSAQPSRKQFVALRSQLGAYSTGAVVKLNGDVEARDEAPDGVSVYKHAWLPAGPVTHEEVEAALAELDAVRPANQFVLAHCEEGRDRTGLLIAIWKVRHHLLSPVAAMQEWITYGSHRFPLLEEAFERETR